MSKDLHDKIMALPCYGFDAAYVEGYNHMRAEAAKLALAAAPQVIADERTILLRLCDQLDGMKRRMRHTPGTGQSHSYLPHDDVSTYVEEARAALAAAPVQAQEPGHVPVRPGHFPQRDPSKPAEQQGVFQKFDVRRTDGSSEPGGKHQGCRYFVLDVDHDALAKPALQAYAAACAATHPDLSADMVKRFDLAPVQAQEPIGYAPGYLPERIAAGDSAVMLTVTRKPLPGHGVTVALYTAPVQPVAVPDGDVKECLLDVISHHGDFHTALGATRDLHLRGNDNDSAAYWDKQLNVLARMKIQAERALAAPAAQGDAKDAERYQWIKANITEGNILPGSFYLSDEDTESWDATIDAAIADKAAS